MRHARLIPPALLILCSLLATTGCGSGQVAQTATQQITQEGANAERGGVAVRGVIIPAPVIEEYEAGAEAPLYVAISTEEGVSDTLTGVTSDAAQDVGLVTNPLAPPVPVVPGAPQSAAPVGSPSASPDDSASASASASAEPSAAPSESASPSGEPSASEPPEATASPDDAASPETSASPGASESESASPSASPGGEIDGLEITKGALIVLGQGKSYLELRGLTRALSPGMTITVTFSFAKAGDIKLRVPVGTPDTPGARVKSSEGAEHE